MMQNSPDENTLNVAFKELQRYKKYQDDIYNELIDPNISLHFTVATAFLIVVIVVPIMTLFDTSIEKQQIFADFPFLVNAYFFLLLGLVIWLGYMNIRFVASFCDRVRLYKEINQRLKNLGEVTTKVIDITKTQHYKLIVRLEAAFISGTFLAACLWFIEPLHNRLEPLTIIYGFGTAIFEYFRQQLGIANPLDRLIESK